MVRRQLCPTQTPAYVANSCLRDNGGFVREAGAVGCDWGQAAALLDPLVVRELHSRDPKLAFQKFQPFMAIAGDDQRPVKVSCWVQDVPFAFVFPTAPSFTAGT